MGALAETTDAPPEMDIAEACAWVEGRDLERAEIVAWLRREIAVIDREAEVWRLVNAADAIERGNHRVTAPPPA